MALDKMTLGSKNHKKEININVGKRHIAYFFGFLMFIVFVVYVILINLGIYDVESMEIMCTDGHYEQIMPGITMYCGEHYSILQDKVSEKAYTNMENIINGD